MSKASRVNTLKLTRDDLSDKGAASLATLLEHNQTSFTRLNINQNNIGDAGMRALSAALEMCRMDLSWNSDVEETTKLDIIQKLIRNLTLRGQSQLDEEDAPLELDLNGLALGRPGVCKVVGMLENNTAIRRFNFADNDIRDVGATAIYEWLNRGTTVAMHLDLDENYDMDDRMKEKIAALLVKNRSLPSLFLQRYRIEHGSCLRRSATSVVYAASDMRTPGTAGSRVALKCTSQKSLKCELKARLQLTLISHSLVGFRGYHAPEGDQHHQYQSESIASHVSGAASLAASVLCSPQAERTNPPQFGGMARMGTDHKASAESESSLFVSVMELADRSMHDLCTKQRVAGYGIGQIHELFR